MNILKLVSSPAFIAGSGFIISNYFQHKSGEVQKNDALKLAAYGYTAANILLMASGTTQNARSSNFMLISGLCASITASIIGAYSSFKTEENMYKIRHFHLLKTISGIIASSSLLFGTLTNNNKLKFISTLIYLVSSISLLVDGVNENDKWMLRAGGLSLLSSFMLLFLKLKR